MHWPVSLPGPAAATFSLALVAIGGITVENGTAVIKAGADLLAAITSLIVVGKEKDRVAVFTA